MTEENVESREDRARESKSSNELEVLATDENSDVRWYTAENPNTPVTALEKLSLDEDKGTRSSVAAHPKISASLSEKMA